jgi:hypothetical protein
MAGATLTIASTLQCPHGAPVQIIPSGSGPVLGGVPVATVADTFLISGCPFTIPVVPPIPSPCITVQWVAGDLFSTAGGAPTLSQSSQGLCLAATGAPQGLVVIVNTAPGAQSQ